MWGARAGPARSAAPALPRCLTLASPSQLWAQPGTRAQSPGTPSAHGPTPAADSGSGCESAGASSSGETRAHSQRSLGTAVADSARCHAPEPAFRTRVRATRVLSP